MPRGSKPGERRGGRKPGTPNKTALVRLDKAAAVVAAQVSALKSESAAALSTRTRRLKASDGFGRVHYVVDGRTVSRFNTTTGCAVPLNGWPRADFSRFTRAPCGARRRIPPGPWSSRLPLSPMPA